MRRVLKTLIRFLAGLYVKKFEKLTENPREAQEKLLLGFIEAHKDTEFGRKHHFDKINSIEDYQKYVPIHHYEDLKPYIDKKKKGHKKVLVNGNVEIFGMTSGTTGNPKFIPVTTDFVKRQMSDLKLMMAYIAKKHPEAFMGKMMMFQSSHETTATKSGIPAGSVYSVLKKHKMKIMEGVFPDELHLIKGYFEKQYIMALLALKSNVSFIFSVNPSTALTLVRFIGNHSESLIDDLRKGKISKEVKIDAKIKEEILKRIKPNPEKAKFLKAILKKNGKIMPRDYWPNLTVINCWKSGNASLYIKHFPDFFGNVAVNEIGYAGTEGLVAIPVDSDHYDNVVAVGSVFIEFIKESDYDNKNPRTYTVDQVEVGEKYYVVNTNGSGLYRYSVKDLIEVSGMYNNTPRIRFLQRDKDVSSVTGEKITEWQVIEAMGNACKKLEIAKPPFVSYVRWDDVPFYEFAVEFDKTMDEKTRSALIKQLDLELRDLNIEYHGKRDSGRLAHPRIKELEPDFYSKYHKARCDQGVKNDSQIKLPALSTKVCYTDNLLDHLTA